MSNAIPIEWIDKHLEWLDNCDNEFAQLATVGIRGDGQDMAIRADVGQAERSRR